MTAIDSKAKRALEVTCNLEIKACNADCDELRTLTGMVKMIMQ